MSNEGTFVRDTLKADGMGLRGEAPKSNNSLERRRSDEGGSTEREGVACAKHNGLPKEALHEPKALLGGSLLPTRDSSSRREVRAVEWASGDSLPPQRS